jgi:hypothetical protein
VAAPPPPEPQGAPGVRFHKGPHADGTCTWRLHLYLGRDGSQPGTGKAIGGKRVSDRPYFRGTLAQAIAERQRLLGELEQRRAVMAAGGRDVTMAILLDLWFERWKLRLRKGRLPSPTTVYDTERIIEKILKPAMGSRRPAEIKTGMLEDWYLVLRLEGYPTERTVLQWVTTGQCRTCGAEPGGWSRDTGRPSGSLAPAARRS